MRILIFILSSFLSACAPKNCEDMVNQYAHIDSDFSGGPIRMSLGLSSPVAVTMILGPQDIQVGYYKSIFTVAQNQSCPAEQTKAEFSSNIFLCASEIGIHVFCKNSAGDIKLISIIGGGFCPTGYTQETKYNPGC